MEVDDLTHHFFMIFRGKRENVAQLALIEGMSISQLKCFIGESEKRFVTAEVSLTYATHCCEDVCRKFSLRTQIEFECLSVEIIASRSLRPLNPIYGKNEQGSLSCHCCRA